MRKVILSALLLVQALPAWVAGTAAGASSRLTDAQTEAMARSAMASNDPGLQAETLKRLEAHYFKSSFAKERELSLFVQGLLEDRAGRLAQAAITFHKLEQTWPHSTYLAEGQVIMAEAAVEHKRLQEAESRLHKALDADIPAESQRRAQELLLWCLAEQGRSGEGAAIVKSLKPLGTARLSERGQVGIMEALCAAGMKDEAGVARREYHTNFPSGPRGQRVDLDWAKLQGKSGSPQGAARGFEEVIQAGPESAEADEARLALATLLTNGTLLPKETKGFPSAQDLLAGMKKANLKDGPAREALMVRLRIAIKASSWKEVIDLVGQFRSFHPSPQEALQADGLRTQAVRAWTQDLLDQHQFGPLLPYLDGEGIRCLTPALRLGLARRLALGGLPEASQAIARLAPPGEKAALLRAALEGTTSLASPQSALGLLSGKSESPQESLVRAQAELALHAWPEARAALAKASPGPDRIQSVLAYLNRPAAAGETPAARSKEVEAWLTRAPEKGADLEPLAILAADRRVQGGDWRGALDLYPPAPQTGNRGWVALMRATCQARLGQPGLARTILRQASDVPAFRNERLALEQQLEK